MRTESLVVAAAFAGFVLGGGLGTRLAAALGSVGMQLLARHISTERSAS